MLFPLHTKYIFNLSSFGFSQSCAEPPPLLVSFWSKLYVKVCIFYTIKTKCIRSSHQSHWTFNPHGEEVSSPLLNETNVCSIYVVIPAKTLYQVQWEHLASTTFPKTSPLRGENSIFPCYILLIMYISEAFKGLAVFIPLLQRLCTHSCFFLSAFFFSFLNLLRPVLAINTQFPVVFLVILTLLFLALV